MGTNKKVFPNEKEIKKSISSKPKFNNKLITIVISSVALVCTVAVSSFAWFTMVNNGQLNIIVPTTTEDGITFTTAEYTELEGSLVPAKMKKGVINNYQKMDDDLNFVTGKIDLLDVPTKEEVLPLRENHTDAVGNVLFTTYKLDGEEFENPSPYIEYPATVAYRQMPLAVGSKTLTKKDATFRMHIQYYDIFNKPKNLSQKDAFTFRFYLIKNVEKDKEGLEDEDLNILTTRTPGNGNKNKKTLDQFFYENKSRFSLLRMEESSGTFTLTAEEAFNYKHLDMYRITPILTTEDGVEVMKFQLKDLDVNTNYTMLFEAYYSLPDELIEGDLCLTNKINVIIRYTTDGSNGTTSEFGEEDPLTFDEDSNLPWDWTKM